jgi:aminocarboxymuconate-semialdehyde decarboxylase
MPVVDTHTHFIPTEFVELLRAGDGPPGLHLTDRDGREALIEHDNGLAYPALDVFHDAGSKLEQMDRDGIDISLVSLSPSLLLYWIAPAETTRAHALINDAAAALCARGGGRLFAMATVPLNDPEAAAAELRRAHDDLGLVGALIGTSVGEVMLDDPSLEPFFATAEELGMPLLAHPYVSMISPPPAAVRGFHLSNVIGNPTETFVAACRLVVGGVLDRHPDLKVQLVHGGGTFPYQLGRLEHAFHARAETSQVAARNPLSYLRNFLFDTALFEPRALDFLLDLAGTERVVFGSDVPFDMADLSPLDLPRRKGAEVADRVLGANALAAYGVAPDDGAHRPR